MKHISIVGYGRFGKVLHRLLKNDFIITVYNRSKITDLTQFSPNTIIANNISDVYKSDVIFYFIPIESFEEVIASHKKYVQKCHLLIDVLSVKLHPKNVFTKYLKGTSAQALLTHPMFGPDSSKNGFEGLPIILDQFKTDQKNYIFWKDFFKSKKLSVIEMSADDHDRLAAHSQGLTHFIGRLLEEYGCTPTPIDSLGTKKLLEVQGQTCNDSWQLFTNLHQYNPYTKKMRVKLGNAFDTLYNKILPKQINPRFITYGIQGGKGSFNEEALLSYVKKKGIKSFSIQYLFTSEKVLKNLHEGNIDFGLFAIQNAVGGVVEESTHALAKYRCHIVDEFAISIRHFLMKRKDIDAKDITAIMAHTQVLRQCRKTLERSYPTIQLTSGKGDLLDTAKAAWALYEGKIPKHTAILGPAPLTALYDFDCIEKDLQDDKKNLTTFFMVSR